MLGPRVKIGLIGLGALGAGLGLGALRAPARATPRAAPSVSEPRVSARVAAPGMTRAELSPAAEARLRQLIREELATASAARAGASAEPAAEPAPGEEPIEPAAIQVFDQARGFVDTSIRRGAWGDGEREQLRDALARVTPELRQELLRPLVVAMNQGRIKVETDGPPF